MFNPSIAVSVTGVMGQLVRKALTDDPELEYIDFPGHGAGIIDFSHPDCLNGIIEYVMDRLDCGHRIPVVIATTGYSPSQIDQIHDLARCVPVVFSSNYSPGVTILTRILRNLSPLMSDWEIEIVETHHKRKLDAPSGTALTLEKALERTVPIHSLRGGDVRGVHGPQVEGEPEKRQGLAAALGPGLGAQEGAQLLRGDGIAPRLRAELNGIFIGIELCNEIGI